MEDGREQRTVDVASASLLVSTERFSSVRLSVTHQSGLSRKYSRIDDVSKSNVPHFFDRPVLPMVDSLDECSGLFLIYCSRICLLVLLGV